MRKGTSVRGKNDEDVLAHDEDENEAGVIKNAEYGSLERPLIIAGLEIPCFVLEGGIRVLNQSGLMKALGMAAGTATAGKTGDRLEKFVSGERLSEFVTPELLSKAKNSIRFHYGSSRMVGYEATILADICEAVLMARSAGKLQDQQQKIAAQCEILMRGFARVGIIALVDEATQYQDFRAKEALSEILRQFISDELCKWVKQFPDDYYKELFRLKGITYNQFDTKRPLYIGKITKNIVYERLAPGVCDALEGKNPKDDRGRRKSKHHMWLTPELGQQRLREHLASVVVLMRASSNWPMFQKLLERSLPRLGVQQLLPGMEYVGVSDE